MKTAKLIIRNSAWLIIGEAISRAFIFLLNVIVARAIGIAGFGKYNFAMSFALIFSTINDLGLNTFIFREVARDKKCLEKYVSNILLIRLCLSFVFFAIIFIVTKVLNYQNDVILLILLFTGWLCFTNLTYVFRTSFKALEVMGLDTIVNISDNFLRLLIGIFAVSLGLGVFGLGAAYLFAAFVAFLLSLALFIVKFTKISFTFDLNIWKLISREIKFFALIEILMPLFGRFDTVIIARFNGDEAVGVYSAALKVMLVLICLPTFVVQSTFPKMSQYAFAYKNKFSNLIGYLLKFNLIITSLISFCIFMTAEQIIFFIYGMQYVAAVRVMQILIWSFPLFGFITIFIYGLNAKNEQKVNAIIIGCLVLFNVVLAIIVAPKFSYLGVAIASVASLSLMSLAFILYYVKKRHLSFINLKFSYNDYEVIKNILKNQLFKTNNDETIK